MEHFIEAVEVIATDSHKVMKTDSLKRKRFGFKTSKLMLSVQ